VAVCFLGDGTLGQGVIYESFNLASLWGAPILYVVENNHIAQTTPIGQALAGDISLRFAAFDILAVELETSDVLEVFAAAKDLLDEVRSQGTPRGLILHTQRFSPHSKGDDTRDPKVVARLRDSYDPIKIQAVRLSTEEKATIESEVNAQIRAAFHQALKDPYPK
jgi:TPP-dependent pyruvate/acetoin dehydrogenase alpha subunit